MESKTKIVDRIRKLYAMAQDSSSPNEAAIAAKRARNLMDKHGVKIEDLQTTEFASCNASRTFKALPIWYSTIALGVAAYNDCMCTRSGGVITFNGYDVDVIGSNLMMDYLVRTMERHLVVAKKESGTKSRAFSSSFRRGFAADMYTRLKALAQERKEDSLMQANMTKSGTSLVVAKSQAVTAEFGEERTKNSNRPVSDEGGYYCGTVAAKETSINRQVEEPEAQVALPA